jgi:hypothetical protein
LGETITLHANTEEMDGKEGTKGKHIALHATLGNGAACMRAEATMA